MRTIREIAQEIQMDWKNVSPYAKPYLNAMFSLNHIDDMYGADDGRSVVAYFVSNAASWKGPKAKEIKKELKDMLGRKASIVRMASEIMAFTVMKPLKLKSEGATRDSIENAQKIKDAGYELESASMHYNKIRGPYHTHCIFKRGDEREHYVFKGFSLGYGGEGPRGLLEFAKIFNIPIDKAKVLGDVATDDEGNFQIKTSKIKNAKYPPQALNLNKLKNTEGFWKLKISDAEKQNGMVFPKNTNEIGDVIFFLNMVGENWNTKNASKTAGSGTVPNFVKFLDDYETDDYPYGRFRTKATFKVEKKGNQERVSRVTIDPKTGRLNKPKYTTYGSAAKLGLTSDNKVYPITGTAGQLEVWSADMMHSVASVFTDEPDYQKLADALGIEKGIKDVQVKKTPTGAVIDGLQGKGTTVREILEIAGLTPEQIAEIDHVSRINKFIHTEWVVHFKNNSEKFAIIVRG